MLLKPNTVLPGRDAPDRSMVEAVAGIAVLSGGQEAQTASARLDAMNRRCRNSTPWPPTFSFPRAVRRPALEIRRGEPAHVEPAHVEAAHVEAARAALAHRARGNGAARRGEHDAAETSNIQ